MGSGSQYLRLLLLPLLTGVLALDWHGVQASATELAPSVAVLATDPGLDGQLGDYEGLYVKFSYQTARQIAVEVEGLSSGRPAPGMMSGGIYPANPGSGEHVLWIAYKAGTRIDGLRVNILDGRERPISHFDLPAFLQWTAKPRRDMSERPEWVQQAYREAQRPTPMSPPTAMDVVFGMGLFYGAPLLYLLMQIWFAIRWTGGWRTGALIPLLLTVPAMLWSVYAFTDGSNLAPIPIIFAAVLALPYLAVLWLARTLTLRLA